jgi:hypothetical protein
MQGMKPKKFPLALCFLFLGFSCVATAAPVCSVKDKLPASARVFAKTNGDSTWSEYRSLAEVPQVVLDSGMTAQFVQHKKSNPSVTMVAPGEDFWLYTRYCYDDAGQLAGLSFELRTSLGWGYRTDGEVAGGTFAASSQEFFRTKDGKAIEKPVGVSGAPSNLKPTLYASVGDLPFAPLLKKKTSAKSHSKHTVALTLTSAGN